MANWKTDVESISMGGIWLFNYRDGLLAHSRYSNIISLISGEGCHSVTVRAECLKQISDLWFLKRLVFWSNKLQCWICQKHISKCCFDWVFECSIMGLMAHGGYHPFHGLTEIFKGETLAVPFNHKYLKYIFEQDMDPRNYNIDYQQWQRDRKSGFVLTTPEIHDHEQAIADEEFGNKLNEIVEKNNLDILTNKKKLQQIRCDIAKQNSICVVNDSPYYWGYNIGTDYFHCFNSYILYQIKTLGIRLNCICKFDRKKSLKCIKDMDISFVTNSYDKYLDGNRNGSLTKDWSFTSNGHGFKLICDNISYAWCEAGWQEYYKIDKQLEDIDIEDIINGNNVNIDMSLLIQTLKLGASYTAHKYLRRAWAGIWSSTTDKCNNNELSPQIQAIKDNFRKGFSILLHFVEESVCLIFILPFYIYNDIYNDILYLY